MEETNQEQVKRRDITTVSLSNSTKQRLIKYRSLYSRKIGFDKMFNELLDFLEAEEIVPE